MTITVRNYYLRVGIIISFLALAAVIAAAFFVLPGLKAIEALASERALRIFRTTHAAFFKPVPYIAYISMGLAVLYSLVAVILIYYFFEKTQSPEILFVALFVLSFSFEALRIMPGFRNISRLPSIYLVMGCRAALFGRYFGVLSLFTAGVYAAGLSEQKQGNIIFILALVTLTVALGVPIDGLSWDSSLMMISAYPGMFSLIEVLITLLTGLSFFIAARNRGSKEYYLVGLGSLLAFCGRALLLGADTWITPLPGLLMLCWGTWLICNELHRVYLWL
jgi:hypothetical protein